MVASNQSAMTANMNTILRECILIANVTNDVEWILISRLIFSHLPMNLRQEAEFTLHMVRNWLASTYRLLPLDGLQFAVA